MRIGFLVDATCDLPESYFSSGDVLVMPISVRIKDHVLVDSRDQAATREYLEGNIAKEAVVKGPEAIDREIERLMPLIREGGFLPAMDVAGGQCLDGVVQTFQSGDVTDCGGRSGRDRPASAAPARQSWRPCRPFRSPSRTPI